MLHYIATVMKNETGDTQKRNKRPKQGNKTNKYQEQA